MNRFKELRKTNHLTQIEFAEKLNVDQSTISKWEKDKAIPDILTLLRLSDIFNVSIDYLFGKDNPIKTLSDEQKKLFNEIQSLSDANCKRVLDFITGIKIAEEEKQKIIELYKRKN